MSSWLMRTGLAFAIQLVVCTFPFVIRFPKRQHFLLQILITGILYFGVTYGAYVIRNDWNDAKTFLMRTSFIFIGMIDFGAILACHNVNTRSALYATIGGYLLQHWIYSFLAIVRFYVQSMPEYLDLTLLIVPYIVIAFGFYRIFVKHSKGFDNFDDRGSIALLLATLVIFLNIVLSQLTSYGNVGDGFVSTVVCRLYSITCSSLMLAQMFGLIKQNELAQDKVILQHLLTQSKGQQKIIEDNIDYINIKTHDLKKQLAALKQIGSSQERNAMIEELQHAVAIYDGVAKTGNEAIDLVLTEFGWRCSNNTIQFDYIINGQDYDFMKLEDVYSLFFNALDNATESVMQENDTEKRMISIKSTLHGDMLYLHILNYCCVKPSFTSGLPLTTKGDKQFHGFGTKSIRYIAEKYGGSVNMNMADEHFFQLEVLFNRKSNIHH